MEEFHADLRRRIQSELDQIPESSLSEVLDFVRFLKIKHEIQGVQPAIASEAVLAEDWLRPEEEGAWQNL